MRQSTKVSIGFVIASVLWIGFSDTIFATFFPQAFPTISLWKGWIFVLLVGVALKIELATEETRRAVLEARLHDLAIHDPLTRPFNRGAFFSHLDAAVERAPRKNSRLGMAYLDLDNIKTSNDTFGQGSGAIRTMPKCD